MPERSRTLRRVACVAAALALAGIAAPSSAVAGPHPKHHSAAHQTYTSPQPASKADFSGHGANTHGPYDSTRSGAASQNGNGKGKAVGKPCAGCVGKADNKNPHGQMPNGSDHNAGYECDRNHGIGRTNPAHTGCQAGVTSTPSTSESNTVSPSTSESNTVSPSTSESNTVSPSNSESNSGSPSNGGSSSNGGSPSNGGSSSNGGSPSNGGSSPGSPGPSGGTTTSLGISGGATATVAASGGGRGIAGASAHAGVANQGRGIAARSAAPGELASTGAKVSAAVLAAAFLIAAGTGLTLLARRRGHGTHAG